MGRRSRPASRPFWATAGALLRAGLPLSPAPAPPAGFLPPSLRLPAPAGALFSLAAAASCSRAQAGPPEPAPRLSALSS